MRKIFIILSITLLVSSCKIYTYPPQPEIKSLLAITSQGDTIQVSTDYLQREFSNNPGQYSNWRFNWDYNWYYGNAWFYNYDPFWVYRIPYQNRVRIQPRPNVSTPRYVPRHFDNRSNPPIRREPQIQPNRGRSNVQPRPNTQPPRTRTTPNVVPNRPQVRTRVDNNITPNNKPKQ